MKSPLEWVPILTASLGRATDHKIQGYSIEDTVDPIKKRVVFLTNGKTEGRDYHPICVLIQAFSKANNCITERVYHNEKNLTAIILTKSRTTTKKIRNPLF